jgi:hypothetical protein
VKEASKGAEDTNRKNIESAKEGKDGVSNDDKSTKEKDALDASNSDTDNGPNKGLNQGDVDTMTSDETSTPRASNNLPTKQQMKDVSRNKFF